MQPSNPAEGILLILHNHSELLTRVRFVPKTIEDIEAETPAYARDGEARRCIVIGQVSPPGYLTACWSRCTAEHRLHKIKLLSNRPNKCFRKSAVRNEGARFEVDPLRGYIATKTDQDHPRRGGLVMPRVPLAPYRGQDTVCCVSKRKSRGIARAVTTTDGDDCQNDLLHHTMYICTTMPWQRDQAGPRHNPACSRLPLAHPPPVLPPACSQASSRACVNRQRPTVRTHWAKPPTHHVHRTHLTGDRTMHTRAIDERRRRWPRHAAHCAL